MHNIAAITGGKNVPSSIYRFRSLVEVLEAEGVILKELCPLIAKYPPKSLFMRPPWLLAAILERLTFLYRTYGYDAVILQRELISTLPTIERLLPGKKILDVDDAIYLQRGGLAAKNAAQASIGVVCGNEFLAETFSQWNSRIAVIPTGVDIRRMSPDPSRLTVEKEKIIGWIGTPGNLSYVDTISNSLIAVIKGIPNTQLRIVTSHPEAIPPSLRAHSKFVKWYPGIEFDELPSWSVGIMPLADDEWTRGKCSFKLLQYLSAGVPAVVSPVGMNIEVMRKGLIGYLAKTPNQWVEGLGAILSNPLLNESMGLAGRKVAEDFYSLEVVAQYWRRVLDSWL